MTTNSYFNMYRATNEQDTLDSMIVESIQIKGIDVVYIERTQANIDYLFSEDPTNIFNENQKIEMYPAFVDGFDGDGEIFSRFGLEITKTGTFILSKSRFATEFPTLTRPREGDLLFMPITNAVLEIKFVDHESPFFEKGKQFVYELRVETFTYSHEEINVTDPEADTAIDDMELERFIEGTNDYTDFEETGDTEADNKEFEDENLIITDPNNPWGVK